MRCHVIEAYLEQISLLERELAMAREENDRLSKALAASVKLQSHYAAILNDYDGGTRIVFADVGAWLKRLTEIGEIR